MNIEVDATSKSAACTTAKERAKLIDSGLEAEADNTQIPKISIEYVRENP